MFVGSAKIVLRFRKLGSDDIAPGHVKLSFKVGGRDEFLELLRTSLKRRDWVAPLTVPLPKPVADAPRITPGFAGVRVSCARSCLLTFGCSQPLVDTHWVM